MSKDVHSNLRPSKREVVVISDDESGSDQPVVKSVKRESEPVLSPEVLELRQKVAKLESDFQGACRYARQFELQLEESKKLVEFLESLLEQKPTIPEKPANVDETEKKLVDKLQKKLAKSLTKLEEAARREEDSARKESEMAQEIVSLKELADSMQKKLTMQCTKLPEAPRKESEMAQETVAHTSEIAPLQSSNGSIDGKQEQPPRRSAVVKIPGDAEDPTNIFTLHQLGADGSVPYSSAIDQLCAKYDDNSVEWRRRLTKAINQMSCVCAACNKIVYKRDVFDHIRCSKHRKKADGHAVSLVAFDHWMRKLESIPKISKAAAVVTVFVDD